MRSAAARTGVLPPKSLQMIGTSDERPKPDRSCSAKTFFCMDLLSFLLYGNTAQLKLRLLAQAPSLPAALCGKFYAHNLYFGIQ